MADGEETKESPPPLPPTPEESERIKRIAGSRTLRWLSDARHILIGEPGRRRVDKKKAVLVILMLGLIEFFSRASVAFIDKVFVAYDRVVTVGQETDYKARKEELEERRREHGETMKQMERQADSIDELTEAIRASLWAQGKGPAPVRKKKPTPAAPARP